MKIENLLLNNFILNNKEEIFNEGHTFKAKILELLENQIQIEIDGRGIIQATLETSIKMKVGDEVTFFVKSKENDEITLRPVIKEKLPEVQISNNSKENNPIVNLLKSINIKETRLSIGLAENLMKYNAPITEQNLTNGIKTLEKLFHLYNLKDEEKVILINQPTINIDLVSNETQLFEETFNTTKDSIINNESLIQENTLEIENLALKEDLKTLLVISKNDSFQGNDITKLVKDFLGNENNYDFEDEYIKIISFFLKNGIKPSLNNIRNLREFNKNPIEFAKDLQLIDKILSKYEISERSKVIYDKNEIDGTKNIITNKYEKLVELQKIFRSLSNIEDLKSTEDIKNLNNKIDFLREMNKDISFVFFPVNHKEKDLNGIFTLIKENKKKNTYNDKTNIYINVETHNLGNVKVSCQLISKSLTVKMNIKDEDLVLFKSAEKQLIEKISLIGYSLDKIEFVIDDNIQIIDSMVSNPNPTYILDVKA